jgi:hypothetical protein
LYYLKETQLYGLHAVAQLRKLYPKIPAKTIDKALLESGGNPSF